MAFAVPISSEGFDANLLEVQVENMLSSPKEPTFTLHNTLGPYGLKHIDHKREKNLHFSTLQKSDLRRTPMKCL